MHCPAGEPDPAAWPTPDAAVGAADQVLTVTRCSGTGGRVRCPSKVGRRGGVAQWYAGAHSHFFDALCYPEWDPRTNRATYRLYRRSILEHPPFARHGGGHAPCFCRLLGDGRRTFDSYALQRAWLLPFIVLGTLRGDGGVAQW